MEAANNLDPMLRYISEIALKTGMRRAEVCSLRWEWLDFSRGKKGYINLPATICKNKKARSIPMLYNVRELLLELRGDAKKTDGAVFRADAGPRRTRRRKIQSDNIDPQGIGQRISRLCERIGLANVSLHTLRHTFATRCLDAGVNPFMVKAWLGHATLTQTDYYTHIGLDEMENAVAKLEARMA